ncbi:MAG: glycosyltransferase, partial [Candidatus Methylomirabilis sp.]|nr:glycosyltransferase [Deltaproteobacteria bacterium]
GEILAEIAASDPRLKVVPGVPLPAGWLGKNHAIHQGVRHAGGDWLLFLDADGELLPGCLSAAMADAAASEADLFTLVPTLVNGSFWEQVVHPVLMMGIFALFPRDQIGDPDSKVASANGPFMLFRRAAYEKIGGHEGVRGDIVEDLTLARKIKEAGLRLRYVSAPTLMRVRMYKSLREIWNGWSKNFYAGAGESLLGVLLGTVLALLFGAGPWLLWPIGLAALLLGGWNAALFGAVLAGGTATLACVGFRLVLAKYQDPPTPRLWLQPLAVFILIGILWNSALRTRFGGGISWKGRTYAGGQAS